MKGMMGMRRIRVGIRGIRVETRRIGEEMQGIRVGMIRIRVEMRGIRGGNARNRRGNAGNKLKPKKQNESLQNPILVFS